LTGAVGVAYDRRGMSRPRVLSAATLALLVLAAAPASARAPNADIHYFEATVVSAGTAFVDYGREGKDPTVTTGSGVDGTESMGWRWETRAVAKAVGNGPLVGTAEITRERAFLNASVVSWSVQMSQYEEDPLCDSLQGKTTFVSDNFNAFHARKSGPGEFVRPLSHGHGTLPTFVLAGGNLGVGGFGYVDSFTCIHGPAGHGLQFFQMARGKQAAIPRGEFTPRSDRSYRHTFTDSAQVGREHSTSDANALHTFQGESRLSVEIEAISERRYQKLGSRYHNTEGGGTPFAYPE
jgi:hypothetical protein